VQNLDNLIRCDSDDLPDHLLGVAIRINPERNQQHSGIFIRYDRKNYIFHFTGEGEKVFLSDPIDNDWCFFKTLKNVKFFIPSVYAHFRRIRRKSNPDYFYFYGGGKFDLNGDYQDDNGLPNYMTCVGFCLAALKHSLRGIDFVRFEDWPSGIIEGKEEGYIKKFFEREIAPNYSDITLEKFSQNVRRITPLDYVTAGFAGTIPVPKAFIDAQKITVKTEIRERIENWSPKL
jgi:hypothetical protein